MNTIICDGSCLQNPGPGAWAYAVIDKNRKIKYCSGFSVMTTNNIMELTAMIEAIKNENATLIYTDSVYVVNGMTSWIEGWKRSGWKNSQKKQVKNLELWQEIDKIYNRKIVIKWIKGHADPDDFSDPEQRFMVEVQNEVDRIARERATLGY